MLRVMIDSDLDRKKIKHLLCISTPKQRLTSLSSKKNNRDGRLLNGVTTDSGVD